MTLGLILAGFLAAAPPSPLETARDAQDRATLERLSNDAGSAAAKAPNDADAQYRAALAYSYLAEVLIEQHDRKRGRQVAEQGIKAGERAVAIKPDAESYRVLATLYGQCVTDVLSGMSYGAKSKAAINNAVERAPKSSPVYVGRGVGNYYLLQNQQAIADFRKAIELDSRNAEAYLWLGLALRKDHKDAEARQAFTKSLELNPRRVWVKQQLDKTPAQ
jgi:tetratricopeptide (TPR) repeat protein